MIKDEITNIMWNCVADSTKNCMDCCTTKEHFREGAKEIVALIEKKCTEARLKELNLLPLNQNLHMYFIDRVIQLKKELK